jgi:tetratricopeptide (TPR) repeat protein
MPRRYFNWKLAVVLVIGFVVLGVTAIGLRQWRRSNRVERGLVLGNKAYDEHRYEDAVKSWLPYLSIERDVPILLKYADAQLNIRPPKSDNHQQAIAAYRTVLREDKNNSEAALKLTEIYLSSEGMAGEAELIATRYLETNEHLKLRRLLAIALARQGKFSEAAAELKNIITEHPDQILAYETLGRLTEQRPQDFPDPASGLFSEAVKNNPSSALAHIIRAAFHLRNEDNVEALADLEQAEKLDLSDPNTLLRLAMEFINANVLDQAEKHLEAVQAADPENQLLWKTWAELALKLKSKAMMLKVADNGLKELSFQPWDFMLIAAELYIRCDELDRAGDCISKLSRKDIAPPITAFLEGLLADKKGHLLEASKSFRRAIGLGNKSPRVRLALALVLSRLGNKQSALGQLRILVSESPNFLDGRIAYARLLAQTGNWAEAAKQVQEVDKISPGNLDAALLYVQAQMQLLAESKTEREAPIWQALEDQLIALEKASNGAFPVKMLQFNLAIFRSQLDKAQQLLNELKDSHPSRIEVAMAEVKLLIAQEKTDETIQKLYGIVSAFPKSVAAVKYLAIILAAEDKTRECEKVIKDSLARIEQPVVQRDLGLFLAGFYKRWNEQEKRYQLLDSLARDLPEDILVLRELLRCEKVIKDLDHAQQLVDKIKTLEGEDGWQWRYEQARIWFAQDNFKSWYPQIVLYLRENLQANPADQASRLLLARTYERAGQLPLAISTYREAYDRSHQDLRIIIPYVKALNKAREFDLADNILQRVAAENLVHPDLKGLELYGYLRRGELEHASDVMEDMLTEDPNNRSVWLKLAMLKMRQNKFDEARELLVELESRDPNSLPVKLALIDMYVRQKKSAKAIAISDKLIKMLDNATAYIIRARTFNSLGNPDKAIEDYNHAVTIEPENIAAWVARSEFYSRSTDKKDKAIADIRQALSIAPGNFQLQKRTILLLLASKNPDNVREGKNLLEEALKKNPDDVDLLLYQASSLIAEETAPAYKKAEGILQKITRDQPELSQACMLSGELSLKQREYEEAVKIALHCLVHKPDDKMILRLKARAEKELSPALAIPTLKLLYEIDPNDTNTILFLADTYIEADEPQKAVELLRGRLAYYSGSADERKVRIALFRALYKNGEKAEFQKELDSLLRSDPNDPGPLLALVLLFKEDKLFSEISRRAADWCRDHPEDSLTPVTIAGELATTEDSRAQKIAEDLLRGVLADHPDSLPAMNTLALLLQLTERPTESARFYRQVLTIQPDNAKAMNNLAWILCEDQSKHKEAFELTQRGLKIAPNYIDLIDTCGVVNYRLGQFEKAVQDFNTCLKLYPKGTLAAVTTYFHLGRTLAQMGQKDGAINNLNKALELNTKIGGLSTEDAAETQRMIDQLSLGG